MKFPTSNNVNLFVFAAENWTANQTSIYTLKARQNRLSTNMFSGLFFLLARAWPNLEKFCADYIPKQTKDASLCVLRDIN